MTRSRHRRDIITLYACMLLIGLGAGHLIDTQGPSMISTITANSCVVPPTAVINPCVILDTSQIEDLRPQKDQR